MEATITTKGQVTLPKTLRTALHLKTGDKLIFEQRENGEYCIIPKTRQVQSLKRLVSYVGEPVSLETMQQAISDRKES